jgi:hypothetical protein
MAAMSTKAKAGIPKPGITGKGGSKGAMGRGAAQERHRGLQEPSWPDSQNRWREVRIE